MLATEVNSFRSYHAALPLASILQTTIQYIACLTDYYLTDRLMPLCKMAESEAERGPLPPLSGAATYKTKFNIGQIPLR